jgi:hypothetical protein
MNETQTSLCFPVLQSPSIPFTPYNLKFNSFQPDTPNRVSSATTPR